MPLSQKIKLSKHLIQHRSSQKFIPRETSASVLEYFHSKILKVAHDAPRYAKLKTERPSKLENWLSPNLYRGIGGAQVRHEPQTNLDARRWDRSTFMFPEPERGTTERRRVSIQIDSLKTIASSKENGTGRRHTSRAKRITRLTHWRRETRDLVLHVPH